MSSLQFSRSLFRLVSDPYLRSVAVMCLENWIWIYYLIFSGFLFLSKTFDLQSKRGCYFIFELWFPIVLEQRSKWDYMKLHTHISRDEMEQQPMINLGGVFSFQINNNFVKRRKGKYNDFLNNNACLLCVSAQCTVGSSCVEQKWLHCWSATDKNDQWQ